MPKGVNSFFITIDNGIIMLFFVKKSVPLRNILQIQKVIN